jgi:DNA-binding response OmpR family regulator
MKVVALEDRPEDATLLRLHLEAAGVQSVFYDSGRALMENIRAERPDLLLLDWELPDIPGDRILRWVREHIGWQLPIIFVTGRDASEDIVNMLEAGADDYMVKPVNFSEMLARITALVRRTAGIDFTAQLLREEPYLIDMGNRVISLHGEPIALTPKEFDLAVYLFRNLGALVSREKLLLKIWGYGREINTRTIDIHVSRIRKKLRLTEDRGWSLTSIYYKGYRLQRTR